MKGRNGAYLDNAATSYPKSRAVKKAFIRTLEREYGNPGRSGHRYAIAAAERVGQAREALAALFDMRDARGVVFTKNATEALNLAIFTLTSKGGHVLYSDMEHNAVLRPILQLENEGKIRAECFSSLSPMKDLQAKMRADTVLVVATQASNVCGRILPVERMGRLCRSKGIPLVIDASQSAGHLPLSLSASGAEVICLPAHKGLGGVLGAGAALFRSPEEILPPFLLGGSGGASRETQMPPFLPEHFEAGSLSVPAIASMEAGVRELLELGIDEIHARVCGMERRLAQGIREIPSLTLFASEETGSGVLSFSHPALSSEAFAAALSAEGFAVRGGLHCAPLAHNTLGTPRDGTVRVGLWYKNSMRDCDRFLSALLRITRAI